MSNNVVDDVIRFVLRPRRGPDIAQSSESDVAGLIVDDPPELICIRSPFVSVAWRISRVGLRPRPDTFRFVSPTFV